MRNPFTASFGVSPPLLVGRDAILAEFSAALADGPGASGRATLYTGARGSGKTVMLNAAEDLARAEGWLVVSETASPGSSSASPPNTSRACCATSIPRRSSAGSAASPRRSAPAP